MPTTKKRNSRTTKPSLASRKNGAMLRKNEERELHTLPPELHLATTPPRAASAEQPQEGHYVYGIIQAREPLTFGKIGIGGRGDLVYTVHNTDIAAVVSKTPVSRSACSL